MFGYISSCPRCISITGVTGPEGIRSIALDFMLWTEPDDQATYPMGTMEICERHDVQELLLVVGDYKALAMERDVVFVAPSQNPWLTYLHLSQDLNYPRTLSLTMLEQARLGWKGLADTLTQKLEEIKLQRAQDRQEAVDCRYTYCIP